MHPPTSAVLCWGKWLFPTHWNTVLCVCAQYFEIRLRWRPKGVVTISTTIMLHNIQFSCFSGEQSTTGNMTGLWLARNTSVGRSLCAQQQNVRDDHRRTSTLLYITRSCLSAAFPLCSVQLTVLCPQRHTLLLQSVPRVILWKWRLAVLHLFKPTIKY